MKTERQAWFSNREFFAMIRSALAEVGHADIPLSRQWIVESEEGYFVHVPVGLALTVPLQPRQDFYGVDTPEALMPHARHFARALISLKNAEKALEKYAKKIGAAAAAAAAEIATARAEGLDLLLDGVEFLPTSAHRFQETDGDDAPCVVTAVRGRRTSYRLRPEIDHISAMNAAEARRELADVIRHQREGQMRIEELDALGADLLVDQITLDLIEDYGLNAEEALRDIWKRQRSVEMKVDNFGPEMSMYLLSANGIVTAFGHIGEGFWNGEHLYIGPAAEPSSREALVGRSLGDLVQHPTFTSRPIVAVEKFSRHTDQHR